MRRRSDKCATYNQRQQRQLTNACGAAQAGNDTSCRNNDRHENNLSFFRFVDLSCLLCKQITDEEKYMHINISTSSSYSLCHCDQIHQYKIIKNIVVIFNVLLFFYLHESFSGFIFISYFLNAVLCVKNRT